MIAVPVWASPAALDCAQACTEHLRAELRAAAEGATSQVALARTLGVPLATLRWQARALGVALPLGRAGAPRTKSETPRSG